MEDLHTCRTWEKFSKVIYNLNNANVKVFQAFRSWGRRIEMWAEKFFPPSDFVPQSFFWTAGAGHSIFNKQINHASNELRHPSRNCGRREEPAILFSRLLLRVLDTCVASFFFGLPLRMNGMHTYQVKKRSCKSVLTFDRSCPHSATFRNTSTILVRHLYLIFFRKNPPGITGMIMWSMEIFQLLPLMIKRNV